VTALDESVESGNRELRRTTENEVHRGDKTYWVIE